MVKNKDRWSALSMKDRADLIKLYVSNGVTSLNDIKKDYNSFGPGGTLENADEAAAAFNPQDTSWDYERVTQNDAEKARQGSIDFYKRWYQSPAREAQGFNAFYEIAREDYELPNADNNEIYEGKYSNGDYSKYLDLNGDGNIDWDETVRVTPMPILPVPKGMGPTVELEGGIKARNWLYDSRIYDDAYTQYRDFISDENLEDLTVEVTSDMPGNLLGSYSASDGNKVKVYRYVGDELQPIITHEGTHKLTRNVLPGSYRDVSKYFAPYTTDESFKSTYSDSYADSTREVYARLNQLRDKLGLDPYKTYTKEDLETIRSNFVDDYFFTRYDDDTLLQLLNNSFKDGGKINRFDDGGNTERLRILDGTEDEQTLSGIPPEEELYQDTILPTINLEDYNRRELRRYAREVANRQEQNSIYGPTFQEVLNDNVLYNSKHSRQEERFKRLVNRQYRRNLRHTEQIARAKAAAAGDVKAFQDYITAGTNAVAPYFVPLVAGPAAGAAASAGAFTALGEMLSTPIIRWPLEALGFGDFVYNNFYTDNGFKKTIKRFKEGDFWGTLGSGAVDLLDLTGTLGAGYDLLKLAKPDLIPSVVKTIKKASKDTKNLLTVKKKIRKANRLYNELSDSNFRKNIALQKLRTQAYNFVPPSLSAKFLNTSKTIGAFNQPSIVPYKLPDGTVIDMQTATKDLGSGYHISYPELNLGGYSLPMATFDLEDGIRYVGPKDRIYPVNPDAMPIFPIQADVNPQFTKYINDVNTSLGNSGVVGGSSVLYNKGYISGVPNDLELITTKSRKADLINRIGFDESSAVVKPMAIESTSKVAGGKGKTEIQVIDEDFEGYATGKLAHELYRILHPEAHATLLSNHALNSAGKTIGGASLRLPKPSGGYYTANELLDAVMASEDAITKKTLIDALSTWKTSVGYTGTKLTRPIGILHNTDPKLQEDILDAIHTMGKINVGEDFKTVKDLYPNMDYSDIAANEKFLEYLGFDKALASNPKAMENITEYYHMQLSSSGRVYQGARTPEEIVAFAHPTKNWGGGSASGAGGNSVIGSGSAFNYSQRSMSQYPLVKNGDSVKSPMDIIKAYEAQRPDTLLSDIASPEQLKKLESLGMNIDQQTKLADVDDFLRRTNDESVTEQAGDILGIHGVFGRNYGEQSQYFGRYSKKSVADSYRIVDTGSGPQVDYEMGRLLHKYKEMASSGQIQTVSIKEYEDFKDTIMRTFDDFLSGKISEKEGFVFTKGAYDQLKQLKKEYDGILKSKHANQQKVDKIYNMLPKLVAISEKINSVIYKATVAGSAALGVGVGLSLRELKYDRLAHDSEFRDSYERTPQYKDDYFTKLNQAVESGEFDFEYFPIDHWYEAMEEQHDNIIDYAKEIKRNSRRESWEYFKQGITDKEQWNDVGKQIKRRFSRKSKNK